MSTPSYDPGRTGLVLIDPVNDFLSPGGKAYPLVEDVLSEVGTVPNLKRLLEGARQRGIQVFFAPMAYTEEDYTSWKHRTGIHQKMFDERMFAKGTWGADYHPDLQPRAGDVIVAPHKNIDAFATTDLDTQLRQHGIDYAVFAGMSASLCVESTLRTGMERGYNVTIVRDATASAGGMEAFEATMKYDFPLIAHQMCTVDEFLESLDRSRRQVREGEPSPV